MRYVQANTMKRCPMTRNADHAIELQFTARHSPRAFSGNEMTEGQMLQLLEAARWAPSASNNQPWRAAYGLRGDAGFAAIAATLADFNAVWAPKAAGLIAWASRSTVTREGGEAPNAWAAFDAGTAWGYLALQAQAMGMISHAMGGFDGAKLAAALHMPAGHTLHAVIAVGYPGNAADLPEALRALEVPNGRNGVQTWAARGKFA
jgi:nitroreductase